MKKIAMFLMVSLFLVGGMSAAQAVVLVPGALAVPTTGTAPVGYGPVLATTGAVPFSFGGTTVMTGTVTNNVYMNTTGLLFEYTIVRNVEAGTNGIGAMSAFNFDGFTVDADYDPAKNTTSGHYPASVYDAYGTIYANFSHPINSGETITFYIQTTAQYYTTGGFSLLGAGTHDFVGFQPTLTPEPGTVALFSTGLLGLLGFRRKRVV